MLRTLAMLPLFVFPTLATAQQKSPQEQWQTLLFMAACAGHWQAAHNQALAADRTQDLSELEGRLAVQRTARLSYFAASASETTPGASRIQGEIPNRVKEALRN